MKLDLHCHSTCSDGSLPAAEVAARAGAFGVSLFCLTDHDTFVGYEATAAALPDVTVLRGIELSCKDHGRTVHLLLYDLREGDGLEALRARTEQIFVARTHRLREICGRLAKLGHHLDPEAILAHGGEAQDSRDAFAALSAEDQASLHVFLLSLSRTPKLRGPQ